MKTVKTAPTAGDIAGLDGNYYLNLPGDPLNPECTYAEAFDRLRSAGKTPPITYAHIARETGHSRLRRPVLVLLLLQPVQRPPRGRLGGDADRLRRRHGGAGDEAGPEPDRGLPARRGRGGRLGRRRGREGGHPPGRLPGGGLPRDLLRVGDLRRERAGGRRSRLRQHQRPACGGWSRARCGSPPTRRSARPAQWLTYEGHWGQREKGFNTGPTGPNTKTQWTEPFTWMDGLRSASPKLPAGSLLGPAATSAFCGTVAAMSNLVNLEARSRFGLFVLLAILAAADRDPGVDHHLAAGRPGADAPAPRLRAAASAPHASSTGASGGSSS